jgi:hypothetical protein
VTLTVNQLSEEKLGASRFRDSITKLGDQKTRLNASPLHTKWSEDKAWSESFA